LNYFDLKFVGTVALPVSTDGNGPPRGAGIRPASATPRMVTAASENASAHRPERAGAEEPAGDVRALALARATAGAAGQGSGSSRRKNSVRSRSMSPPAGGSFGVVVVSLMVVR